MSQENLEVVCEMVRAWARGDRDAARAAFDPEVTWVMPVIDNPVSVGVAAMEQAVETWRREWADYGIEIEEAIDVGDQIVVATKQRGTGTASGAYVEQPHFGVYAVRDSKIVRVEFFDTKAEALAAAGVEEP